MTIAENQKEIKQPFEIGDPPLFKPYAPRDMPLTGTVAILAVGGRVDPDNRVEYLFDEHDSFDKFGDWIYDVDIEPIHLDLNSKDRTAQNAQIARADLVLMEWIDEEWEQAPPPHRSGQRFYIVKKGQADTAWQILNDRVNLLIDMHVREVIEARNRARAKRRVLRKLKADKKRLREKNNAQSLVRVAQQPSHALTHSESIG